LRRPHSWINSGQRSRNGIGDPMELQSDVLGPAAAKIIASWPEPLWLRRAFDDDLERCVLPKQEN